MREHNGLRYAREEDHETCVRDPARAGLEQGRIGPAGFGPALVFGNRGLGHAGPRKLAPLPGVWALRRPAMTN